MRNIVHYMLASTLHYTQYGSSGLLYYFHTRSTKESTIIIGIIEKSFPYVAGSLCCSELISGPGMMITTDLTSGSIQYIHSVLFLILDAVLGAVPKDY